mmetsp:Transcript_4468/g.11774  ORF Transcript_4468/g.11774 Transcript_4468/m.11774 type:complete len:205 (-) Transcript_4468:733-1347(-)
MPSDEAIAGKLRKSEQHRHVDEDDTPVAGRTTGDAEKGGRAVAALEHRECDHHHPRADQSSDRPKGEARLSSDLFIKLRRSQHATRRGGLNAKVLHGRQLRLLGGLAALRLRLCERLVRPTHLPIFFLAPLVSLRDRPLTRVCAEKDEESDDEPVWAHFVEEDADGRAEECRGQQNQRGVVGDHWAMRDGRVLEPKKVAECREG